jgi:hypothetical protein
MSKNNSSKYWSLNPHTVSAVGEYPTTKHEIMPFSKYLQDKIDWQKSIFRCAMVYIGTVGIFAWVLGGASLANIIDSPTGAYLLLWVAWAVPLILAIISGLGMIADYKEKQKKATAEAI